jgi:hypothetical protein
MNLQHEDKKEAGSKYETKGKGDVIIVGCNQQQMR